MDLAVVKANSLLSVASFINNTVNSTISAKRPTNLTAIKHLTMHIAAFAFHNFASYKRLLMFSCRGLLLLQISENNIYFDVYLMCHAILA